MDFSPRNSFKKKVREIKKINKNQKDIFLSCLKKSLKNISTWNTDSEYQKNKINDLLKDLNKLFTFIEIFDFEGDFAFNKLYLWIEKI